MFADTIPEADRDWIDKVRQRMLGMPERAYATYAMTCELIDSGFQGCFVECGVFAGVHPAIMWRALASRGIRDRKIHLFDSFEGIPHAGFNDTDNIAGTLHAHGRDGALKSTGISACSEEAVKSHMAQWGVPLDSLVFHKGWVEDTVPPAAGEIGDIAMLRIDVDLYSATKTCLDHLLPKLQRGGYLVIDDMNLGGCVKATHESAREHGWVKIDEHGAQYTRWW